MRGMNASTSRTVVLNADLRPVGAESSAILVENGCIDAVVPMHEADQLPVAGSRVVDAAGATVLPGMDDSHLHGYEYGRSLLMCDLRGVASIDELTARLRAATPEANGWIRGVGWDGTALHGTGPGGTISAVDLEPIRPGIPMLLGDVTGHQAVANLTALQRAGVTATTPDPIGGSFVRDESGMPSGLIYEAAVGIVNDAIPPLTIREQREAILTAQKALLAQGVTAFTDPGLGPGARTLMDGTGDLNAVEAYRQLDNERQLLMRVNVMLLFGGLGGTRAIDVSEGLDAWGAPWRGGAYSHLDIAQVKVFADGIPRSRTAWLTEPYDDCSCGHLQVAGETDEERVAELHAIVEAAISRGWQVGAHSIGDRTITTFLDAVERSGRTDLRHYVIHGDLVVAEDLARMARLDMALNTNPSIRWMVGRTVSPIIGDKRNVGKQPLRSAIDEGVRLALSSDAPVMTPDWRIITAAAITRSLRTDPDYTDRQCISAREAVQAMTSNAAWQSYADQWRGAISPGMAADFLILDGTADWSDPWSLTERDVAATFVDGECVHGGVS